jgi:predicted Zn-dependent protease
MSKEWNGVALGLAGLALLACSDSTGPGDEGVKCDTTTANEWVITQTKEREMGSQFDAAVRDGSGLESGERVYQPTDVAGRALVTWFETVGKSIVATIPEDCMEDLIPSGSGLSREDFFKFTIIESETVNAFAVPGGYVYFYTGILKELQNEAEVAGVLGHEIGHVVMHHSRDQMADAGMIDAIGKYLLGDASVISQVVTGMTAMQFSQGDEFEADWLGTYYSSEAGENPEGIKTFFSRGLEFDAAGACVTSTSDAVFGIFSTHPPSCERVTAVAQQMSKMEASVRQRSTKATEYGAMVTAAGL